MKVTRHAALSAVLSIMAAASVFPAEIRGVYSFMWAGDVQKHGMPRSVDLPYIDGVTVITEWRLIQPEENRLRWELIDAVLTNAAKYGKKVNVGIFPGTTSPVFVLSNAVLFTSGRNTHAGEAAGNAAAKNDITFPLPWDERYMKAWFAFLKMFAARYANHPSIGYLQISGPSVTAMEMTIRLDVRNWQRFRDSGYCTAKYIDCWKQNIDAMRSIWPGVLSLTLGGTIPDAGNEYDDTVWQAVERYAREKLGSRLILKVAFLNGKWWHTQKQGNHAKPLIDHMKTLSGVAHTGGEMFWKSSIPDESVNGPLALALENGIACGMKWIEVYQADIGRFGQQESYAAYVETLTHAHAVLTK